MANEGIGRKYVIAHLSYLRGSLSEQQFVIHSPFRLKLRRVEVHHGFNISTLTSVCSLAEAREKNCYKIQDTRYKIQDTRHKTQDTRYKIQNTTYKIQDTRYKILDTRYKIQDTRY